MSAKSEAARGKLAPSDRVIPIRRVPFSDQMQLPADYSATPGGTLFSTTPGGTRLIYDREFLMHCRDSPLTKTPPANLPHIPGVTEPANNIAHRENVELIEENEEKEITEEIIKKNPEATADPQFAMDI
jgi:hypothetical protein